MMKAVHVRLTHTPDGKDVATFDPALNAGVWSSVSLVDPVNALDPIVCTSRNGAVNAIGRELCALGFSDRPLEVFGFDKKLAEWRLHYTTASFVAQARRTYVEDDRRISVARWRLHPTARNLTCETCLKPDFMFKDVCVGCYRT